jgi:aryl-alcohol dehydrogenase-like predicted oxidoreductase
MGSMTFGGQVPEDEAVRIVDRCLDHGINFFDTANIYNLGRSESVLGKALRGRRHKIILATKVRGKMGEEPDDVGLSRSAVRKAIDGSLKRLATDYVDLYYLHQPDANARIEETLAVMDELVQEGKVRFPATSNYASWQILDMLWKSENRGFLPPTISQPMYNVVARAIEQEYLPFCKEFGIAVVPYNPLAGGLLSGKHSPGQPPAPGTRFEKNELYQGRYWHAEFFEAVTELSKIAQSAGMSLIALAFRWLLSQSMVDSVILGASSLPQLEENLKACEGPPLGEDVLRACDAVWSKLRGVTPVYNR